MNDKMLIEIKRQIENNKKELLNIKDELNNLKNRQAFIEGKSIALDEIKLMLEAGINN